MVFLVFEKYSWVFYEQNIDCRTWWQLFVFYFFVKTLTKPRPRKKSSKNFQISFLFWVFQNTKNPCLSFSYFSLFFLILLTKSITKIKNRSKKCKKMHFSTDCVRNFFRLTKWHTMTNDRNAFLGKKFLENPFHVDFLQKSFNFLLFLNSKIPFHPEDFLRRISF